MTDLENNPFGTAEVYRPRFSVKAMFLLIIICQAICFLLLLASRVPMISNAVNDFMGLPRQDPGAVDRRLHLLFLISCYAAPLAVTAVVSLLHLLISKLDLLGRNSNRYESEPESPFV